MLMLLFVIKPVWKISSCQSVFAVHGVKSKRGVSSLVSCSLYNSLNCPASTMAILSTTDFHPKEVLMFTLVCPSFAFLVVIMITPFAPRTPKIANDDGSFRISIDSISSGFRKLMLSLKSPSTMYKGLYPLIELVPRIRISGSSPARPLLTICTPAILPCKEESGLVEGLLAISSPLILVMEPVKSRFFALPYPMTTVSANICELS